MGGYFLSKTKLGGFQWVFSETECQNRCHVSVAWDIVCDVIFQVPKRQQKLLANMLVDLQ